MPHTNNKALSHNSQTHEINKFKSYLTGFSFFKNAEVGKAGFVRFKAMWMKLKYVNLSM